jgi:hypothetical protein
MNFHRVITVRKADIATHADIFFRLSQLSSKVEETDDEFTFHPLPTQTLLMLVMLKDENLQHKLVNLSLH